MGLPAQPATAPPRVGVLLGPAPSGEGGAITGQGRLTVLGKGAGQVEHPRARPRGVPERGRVEPPPGRGPFETARPREPG